MIRVLFILFIVFITSLSLFGKEKQVSNKKIKIDSIQIYKNWRTRDAIIRAELDFQSGDSVSIGALDTMVIRIWNIGNFAKVDYQLDTLDDGNYFLEIIAKDAFTIVPIFSFNGNQQDWSLGLGMSDRNFLGRNIHFNISGTIGTNDKGFNIGVTLPRQLLYKNMSIRGSALYGEGRNFRYVDREKTSGVAYKKIQVAGGISNPWHEDFKYRFSPDFGWSVFHHDADSSLADMEVPVASNYTINYVTLSLGESIGYIRRMRHQKDGYLVNLGIGAGIGLDKNSPFYYSIGLGAQYYKLFNKVIQFGSEFSTGYTSSTIPSLLFYKGANDVKGILTGEISGQSFYTASLGWNFTYVNRDWFAMEQSFYVNLGNGTDNYVDLYDSKPLYGVGTGFFFNIPVVPWLAMRLFFTYSGKKSNWFRLEI